ncbi:hypothetical protein BDN72DRAFT_827482, partial [Pluteus cervinus]
MDFQVVNKKNTHNYSGAASVTQGNTTNSTWDSSSGKQVDNSRNSNTYNGGDHFSGGAVNGNVTGQKVEIHNILHRGAPSPEQKTTPEEKFREGISLRAVRSALYNAPERGDPPKCHPRTRLAIQGSLNPWPAQLTGGSVRLLLGWTGTGKTTIAQTMAEYWAQQGWLVLSFFFSRLDEDRCSTDRFAGTILHQLLQSRDIDVSIEKLAPFTIPRVSWSNVIDVLRSALPLSAPVVVVIDGLDECRNHKEQQKLLRDILGSVDELGPSIKILICCRPERHLENVLDDFASKLGPPESYRMDLGQSAEDNKDIRTFLQLSFDRLCEKRRKDETMSIMDRLWPSQEEIEVLVDRASGQFIFAAIVVDLVD